MCEMTLVHTVESIMVSVAASFGLIVLGHARGSPLRSAPDSGEPGLMPGRWRHRGRKGQPTQGLTCLLHA